MAAADQVVGDTHQPVVHLVAGKGVQEHLAVAVATPATEPTVVDEYDQEMELQDKGFQEVQV
jgi:hypothetical protein